MSYKINQKCKVCKLHAHEELSSLFESIHYLKFIDKESNINIMKIINSQIEAYNEEVTFDKIDLMNEMNISTHFNNHFKSYRAFEIYLEEREHSSLNVGSLRKEFFGESDDDDLEDIDDTQSRFLSADDMGEKYEKMVYTAVDKMYNDSKIDSSFLSPEMLMSLATLIKNATSLREDASKIRSSSGLIMKIIKKMASGVAKDLISVLPSIESVIVEEIVSQTGNQKLADTLGKTIKETFITYIKDSLKTNYEAVVKEFRLRRRK